MQNLIMGALVEFAEYLKTHPQAAVIGGGAPEGTFDQHFSAFCAAKGLDMADVDPDWALKCRIDMPLGDAALEDMLQELEIRVEAVGNVSCTIIKALFR